MPKISFICSRRIKKAIPLVVLVFMFLAIPNASAVGFILEFEDLPLNHISYHVGDSFTTSGVPVQVVKFQPVGGGALSGTALVDNWGMAGSTGNELSLTNADLRLQLDLGGTNHGIFVLFGDEGGGVNLGINGDVKKAANFADFSDTTIGGVSVTISDFPTGILLLSGGDVTSLTIGGAHLYVDYFYIACNRVPDVYAKQDVLLHNDTMAAAGLKIEAGDDIHIGGDDAAFAAFDGPKGSYAYKSRFDLYGDLTMIAGGGTDVSGTTGWKESNIKIVGPVITFGNLYAKAGNNIRLDGLGQRGQTLLGAYAAGNMQMQAGKTSH